MTQQLQVSVAKLYEEIGRLTVENEALRQLVTRLQEEARAEKPAAPAKTRTR